ncbi:MULTISPECIES: GNAT family N-acetyltransferase [Methylosinus]|uniref:GNAT family N-acetyltransferase n=1 Tax=Methylosinus TaxID=425 RepID=UPI0001D2F100|nr:MULTISPECIES: GNAT family N-acetyltransferase [Methylosinus]OBS53657.1 hypothetical protein A8B73_04870 [Methylosinus sp. 3S-1]
MASRSWRTISAQDYEIAFERFGGSFAVHPRVVDLVCSLAHRPAHYMGLACGSDIVAAAPLWGEHIVATRSALEAHDASQLIDVGDAELVLPIADGVRIEPPFAARMVSSLHVDDVAGLERDFCSYPGRESIASISVVKGLRAGTSRQSPKSQKRRRLQIRRFQERGGAFHPLRDCPAHELAAIYEMLYRKRWGEGAFLLGEDHLPLVFRELGDMLFGDMLLLDDRPVAMELVYETHTPRWLIANGVQAGYDPAFIDLSVGSILLHHNLERLEEEAIAGGRMLRYSLGWSDAPYKAQWAVDEPAWRVRAPVAAAVAAARTRPDAAAAASSLRHMVASVSFVLRRRAQRAAKALTRIGARGRTSAPLAESDPSAFIDQGIDE